MTASVPELGGGAARARRAQQDAEAAAAEVQEAEAEPQGPLEVRAAFIIYITNEGECVLNLNSDLPIAAERVAHWDEIKGACLTIAGEIQGQQTAAVAAQQATQGTLGGLMQIQQQMQGKVEQLRAQAVLEAERSGNNGQPAGTPPAFRR